MKNAILTYSVILALSCSILTAQEKKPSAQEPEQVIKSDRTLEKDLEVKAGEKLVINAGVTIRFARDAGIVSEGIIEAVGTSEKPIVFTASDPNKGWKNLSLKGRTTNGSILQFCRFTHGKGRYFKFNQGLQIEKEVTQSAKGATGCGGALFLYAVGDVIIEDCVFLDNESGWSGGAVTCWGESHPVIRRNVFKNNKAGEDGGAIHCVMRSAPLIVGNHISGNSAQYGGGIHCLHFSHPSIMWNYVVKNSATKSAGAFSNYNECYPTITGNYVAENSAPNSGALNAARNSLPRLIDNCFLNNHSGKQAGRGFPPEFKELSSLGKDELLEILKKHLVPEIQSADSSK